MKLALIHIYMCIRDRGAGASGLRNETTKKILEEIKVSVIRGNLSELSFIAGLSASTKGVDSSDADLDKDPVVVASTVANLYGCTAALTGKDDVITDGNRCVKLSNGTAMLSSVTGSGCLTSALLGAYIGAVGDGFTASCGAILTTSIAGEPVSYTHLDVYKRQALSQSVTLVSYSL